MSIFKRLIKDRRTSQDFDAAINEAADILKTNGATLDELRARLPALLLEGTDADVREVEGRISDIELDIRRVEAASGELVARRADAAAAEREAGLTTLEARARELANLYPELGGKYLEMARKMVAIVVQAKGTRQELRRINQQLNEAGRKTVKMDIEEFREGRNFYSYFEDHLVLPNVNGMAGTFWTGGELGPAGRALIED